MCSCGNNDDSKEAGLVIGTELGDRVGFWLGAGVLGAGIGSRQSDALESNDCGARGAFKSAAALEAS